MRAFYLVDEVTVVVATEIAVCVMLFAVKAVTMVSGADVTRVAVKVVTIVAIICAMMSVTGAATKTSSVQS